MRADVFLVEQGYAETRADAQAAILSGKVISDGRPVVSPSQSLNETCRIKYTRSSMFVSPDALLLAAALRHFELSPYRRVCLDLGAGRGGFSQVLLARGAAQIFAVDIGSELLHAKIAKDPRVANLEGTDACALARKHVSKESRAVGADLAATGLRQALPQALGLAASGAWLVALVRPANANIDKVALRGDIVRWLRDEQLWSVLGTMECSAGFFVAATKP